MRYALILSAVAVFASPAFAACPAAPFGNPQVNSLPTIEVCHTGYLSLLDPVSKETRIVAYELTAAHSHGTFPRKGMEFKTDPLAPAEAQGHASTYAHTPYDLGHMAPAEDFAWNETLERESFSMANVEPQLAGLNRQGWERLEETARAEACVRGRVDIFSGPIYPAIDHIGSEGLPVPKAFFKVVVDSANEWGIAFIAPQAALTKGDALSTVVSINAVEQAAGISLPLPPMNIERVTLPDADALESYRAGKCRT